MKRYDFYLDEEVMLRLDKARKEAGMLSRSSFLRLAIMEKLVRSEQ
jgi:metal-responsive CopG/Arc/MetJ family transcriptional regulator